MDQAKLSEKPMKLREVKMEGLAINGGSATRTREFAVRRTMGDA